MPTAYSYLRFSSPQQATGDSIRRQTQARESWLSGRPDVELDRSLKMTDAGRSAFKRHDWDTYALARFVDHIKSGRVEPGSYLLVENLDRLSREDAGTATELFLSIVNKGVVVVQLMPVVMEFKKPVNVQSLMFAIVELSRGNSESAAKSERVGAAWTRKQKEAGSKVVTRRLPAWVVLKDGKLSLDKAKAEAVRRIFRMARDGHGVYAIANRLNEEGVPVIGRTHFKGRATAWCTSTIHHILKSPAAIGTYVPYRCRTAGRKPPGDPVPGYFPPVIDAATYQAVQQAIATRKRCQSGRRGKYVNLFGGLVRDARTGGSLTYRHHATDPTLLVPVDALQGRNSKWTSFPADDLERKLLERLREVKASDVAGDSGSGERAEELAGRVAEVDTLIKLWTAKMDNPDTVDVVAAKLAELHAKRKGLAAELAAAQREALNPAAESWGEFKSLAALLDEDDSPETRVKVQAALRRAITEVWLLFVAVGRVRYAAAQVFFGGERSRHYVVRREGPLGGPGARAKAVVECLDGAGVTKLDLRKRDDAAKAEALLARLKIEQPKAEGGSHV